MSPIAPELEQQRLTFQLQAAHATPQIIQCKSETVSTNDDILKLYHAGYRSALAVSQIQHQGRGQHQRQWISNPGNIFLSALIELQRPVDGRFALECGLNLIHSPTLNTLPDLQIKWANDLYSSQGKWGGILVEPINPHQVIVGIGINIFPVEQQMGQATTSLTQLGLTYYDRVQFLAEIYLALLQAAQWFNYNSQNLAQRFNHIAAFKDQWVKMQRNHQADLHGFFRGIQDDGAILIQQSADQIATVCYDGRLHLSTSSDAEQL
ncbi:BirA family transcriptional regulator, biotin operon repressor / biotin-[acetyl-CoA-carboxylase] ligase [Acinetobacter puyangensis]|uniref:BirA family transcriptional regulator, biotin operon repressor / biotin-[acetyl-CoA-carboxylase] ligase n=1 Tax=Acinetobacter puyangensis TaxID=1096779 RepID=A0A240EC34_9GAMM|nr:BirA family transcriptional regulator, biotin operon repressor / biotin-[acetyl-CoA-carboxylase] ligase [Acinetobacter puyangensis]